MGSGPRQRRVKPGEGKLAQTFTEAMRLWDAMKTDGISMAERLKILTKTIRQSWPFSAEYFYRCERCHDTGLVIETCQRGARCDGISTRTDTPGAAPGRYRRLCALNPDSEYQHEYGVACWCSKGQRYQPKPKGEQEDFTAATKVRQPTRIGR